MSDLAKQLQDCQRGFDWLRDQIGIDAEFHIEEKDGKVVATSCTRSFGQQPVIFDGEFSYVRRETLKLWTMILRAALDHLSVLPDEMVITPRGPHGDPI